MHSLYIRVRLFVNEWLRAVVFVVIVCRGIRAKNSQNAICELGCNVTVLTNQAVDAS